MIENEIGVGSDNMLLTARWTEEAAQCFGKPNGVLEALGLLERHEAGLY